MDAAQAAALLVRSRKLILGVALVAAALSALVSLARERRYEAVSTLALSRGKTDQDQLGSGTVANLRAIVYNFSVAETVVAELRLGEAPYFLTAWSLLDQYVAVDLQRDAEIIRVRAVFPDPAIASKIANRISALAVEGVRRLSQQESIQARDSIKAQLDESRQRLEQARAALTTYRREAQIELLRRDVDAMLAERAGLLRLAVDIAAERARMQLAEAELAKRQSVNTFTRSVLSEPALAALLRDSASEKWLGLSMASEEPNLVYQQIEQVAVDSRVRLAALEQQREQLIGIRKLDARQQERLAELYERESQLAQLQMNQDIVQKVVSEITTRYEVARLQVEGRSAQLVVIDPALVPVEPLPRGGLRNAVLGLVFGLSLAVVGVLLAAWVRDLLRAPSAA